MKTKATGWTPGPWSVDARADLNTGELRYIIRAPIDGEDDDAFEEIAQIVNARRLPRKTISKIISESTCTRRCMVYVISVGAMVRLEL